MSDSLNPSFLVSDVSKSLRCSPKMSDSLRSLKKKGNHERIAQVAHQKWANEWIARFLSESLIRSFFRKKLAIRSENQWANSQPWCTVQCTLYIHSTMYVWIGKQNCGTWLWSCQLRLSIKESKISSSWHCPFNLLTCHAKYGPEVVELSVSGNHYNSTKQHEEGKKVVFVHLSLSTVLCL